MKPILGWLVIFLLASCANPTAVPISVPIPTDTAVSTKPTPNTEPPLVLGSFSARLEGVGTHGTMACFEYAGPASDLENIKLTASISQGSKVLEKFIAAQVIDGKNCFEVVDAKYVSVNPKDGTLVIPEEPVKLEITATAKDGRQLTNSKQTLDLGKYTQFPFMEWIFPVNDIACFLGIFQKSHQAWDFIPMPTSEFSSVVGMPVLAPFGGVIESSTLQRTSLETNDVILYSPQTGYFTQLGHIFEYNIIAKERIYLAKEVGKEVSSSSQIAIIGPKDNYSTVPHIHMRLVNPSVEILSKHIGNSGFFWEMYQETRENPRLVDFVKEKLFLNDLIRSEISKTRIYPVGCTGINWGSIPEPEQQLPIKLDGKADDWASYKPVLTDPAGDSELGTTMDFTELYTAKDDNYLYLMLKAGKKPSKEWAVDFNLDLNEGGQCGLADKTIEVWSQYPDAFIIQTLDECGGKGDGKRFTSQYKWGDVLEIRIPLVGLGDYKTLDITEVKAVLVISQGQTSNPDVMP